MGIRTALGGGEKSGVATVLSTSVFANLVVGKPWNTAGNSVTWPATLWEYW